jgi:type IV pilus assembly protein PilN
MIRINLLKPETRDIKETAAAPGMPEFKPKKAPNYGNLIFLVLVVGLGAFYYLQRKAFDRENALLATAKQEKESLQYVTAKLEELKQQRASLERRINLINDLKAQQGLAVRIMDELSRALPDWVWLTEMTYNNKGIQIKGKALSNNLIADYIANLENSPFLMNVNLVSSTLRKTQRNEYYEFGLNAVVEVKAEAAPAAKPGTKAKPTAKKRGTP